jgi:hypothetical protein
VTDFVCDVAEYFRSACEGLDSYGEHAGKRYCVLHFPGEEKREDFRKVLEGKLAGSDYDFGGTIFPDGTSAFEGARFDADATFSGVTFYGDARFYDCTFQDVSFSGATFCQRAYFWSDFFTGRASFDGATFNGYTSFPLCVFYKDANFLRATVQDNLRFQGRGESLPLFARESQVRFMNLIAANPERVEFESLLLRPSWFIGVDTRKFTFTNVTWYGLSGNVGGGLDEEIETFQHSGWAREPFSQLSKVCTLLSANAEENHQYSVANEFHYWSMDATRKGDWSFFNDLTWRDLLKWKSWPAIVKHFGLITTLYWALSGYGVRATRAFWALVVIWAAFATLYVLVDPSEFKDFGQGIGCLWQTAVYSLLALARLNPEPRPEEPGLFQFLVGLEGILGPLQIALLALAIRRHVMR